MSFDGAGMARGNPVSGKGHRAYRVAQLHAQVMAAFEQREYAKALDLCEQSWLPLARLDPQALYMAGILCYLLGQWDAARTYQTRLLGLVLPSNLRADTLTNRALTWAALHQSKEAEADYRASLKLNPRQPKAWGNLGNLLTRRSIDLPEALECYSRALEIQPNYVHAWTNLGFAREQIKDWVGAEQAYQQALVLDAFHLPALQKFAELLERLERPQEALDVIKRALAVDPNNLQTVQSGLALHRNLADWTETEGLAVADFVRLLRSQPEAQVNAPLLLMACPEISPRELRQLGQRFARDRWRQELSSPPVCTRAWAQVPERLRVGYLSADFRNHPVAHLITEVIAHHDRSKFEIYLYAYGPEVEDACRMALRDAADHFVDVAGMDDLAAAQRIHTDAIDVLVDLTGYTTHARLGITALRPAPVIASWIGFIGTLGEPRLADYVIGDGFVMPSQSVDDFSEHHALLPHCFQPNSAWAPVPLASSRSEQGLPQGVVVFCSFNQAFKFTAQMWDAWCTILRAVPGSVLWIPRPKQELAVLNLQGETSRRGVAPARLIFAPRVSLEQHWARIGLADLALDTSPYNSGTTASDVLRCGVPLLTLTGQSFASRMAGSLLHGLDLPDLVTHTVEDYVARAIDLGRNENSRREVQERLLQNLRTSPVFKPEFMASQVERLFQQMYANALAGSHQRIELQTQS